MGWERDENGKRRVKGEHRRINYISDGLAERLLENGADLDMIKAFASPDWDPAGSDSKGEDGEASKEQKAIELEKTAERISNINTDADRTAMRTRFRRVPLGKQESSPEI